jgi:hypothetical protein
MSDYQRYTADSTREVLRKADEILTERGGLQRTRETRHSVTYSGPEGTVVLDVHRHGLVTDVVARTNQLRTSKLDSVVRYLLNQLPFQPGDPITAW